VDFVWAAGIGLSRARGRWQGRIGRERSPCHPSPRPRVPQPPIHRDDTPSAGPIDKRPKRDAHQRRPGGSNLATRRRRGRAPQPNSTNTWHTSRPPERSVDQCDEGPPPSGDRTANMMFAMLRRQNTAGSQSTTRRGVGFSPRPDHDGDDGTKGYPSDVFLCGACRLFVGITIVAVGTNGHV
jgi:hypothetical protein